MHIVCPDAEPQYRELVEGLADARLRVAGHTFEFFDSIPRDDAELADRIATADGILLLFSLPAAVLERSERLRVVSWSGTGVARFVDLEAAARAGVTVCNVPSYGANAVAEHALGLALAVARRIPSGDGLVRSGEWRQFEGVELTGRRMGVVGAGPIGERMVALGRGIGMDVVAWTRNPSPERAIRLGAPFVELDELFSSSDVVSLHLVHTAATEKLVTRELLDRLGPTGILVNTARAELVDAEALAEALRDERIWGAGIDVFDPEPADPDSELVQSERAVVTPHVGYYTGPANDQLLARAIENLRAFADGQPTNVVS